MDIPEKYHRFLLSLEGRGEFREKMCYIKWISEEKWIHGYWCQRNSMGHLRSIGKGGFKIMPPPKHHWYFRMHNPQPAGHIWPTEPCHLVHGAPHKSKNLAVGKLLYPCCYISDPSTWGLILAHRARKGPNPVVWGLAEVMQGPIWPTQLKCWVPLF